MGEHRTGKKRTKRDGAETAKDRKKKRRIVEDAKTASDLRPIKMKTKDRKEREVTGAWEPAAVKLTDAQKKIRALKKKLTHIEELAKKQKAGAELDQQQLTKVCGPGLRAAHEPSPRPHVGRVSLCLSLSLCRARARAQLASLGQVMAQLEDMLDEQARRGGARAANRGGPAGAEEEEEEDEEDEEDGR